MTITQEDYRARLMTADPDKLSPIQKQMRAQEYERQRLQAELRGEFPTDFYLRPVQGETFGPYRPRFRISGREGAIPFPHKPRSLIGLDIQSNPVTCIWSDSKGSYVSRELKGFGITLKGSQWIRLDQLREWCEPTPCPSEDPYPFFAAGVSAAVDDMALYVEECAGHPVQLSERLTEEFYRLRLLVDNEAERMEEAAGDPWLFLAGMINREDRRLYAEAELARLAREEAGGEL